MFRGATLLRPLEIRAAGEKLEGLEPTDPIITGHYEGEISVHTKVVTEGLISYPRVHVYDVDPVKNGRDWSHFSTPIETGLAPPGTKGPVASTRDEL